MNIQSTQRWRLKTMEGLVKMRQQTNELSGHPSDGLLIFNRSMIVYVYAPNALKRG